MLSFTVTRTILNLRKYDGRILRCANETDGIQREEYDLTLTTCVPAEWTNVTRTRDSVWMNAR